LTREIIARTRADEITIRSGEPSLFPQRVDYGNQDFDLVTILFTTHGWTLREPDNSNLSH
jgi:hypothetical protein